VGRFPSTELTPPEEAAISTEHQHEGFETYRLNGRLRRRMPGITPEVGAELAQRVMGDDPAATVELLELYDADPQALRRFGHVPVRHARLVLHALGGGRPVVRPLIRGRESRSTRRARSSSRAGPDDPDLDPPASAFQRAHRALLHLTALELDALADVAHRRAAWLRHLRRRRAA
jgi:hypothetical protein